MIEMLIYNSVVSEDKKAKALKYYYDYKDKSFLSYEGVKNWVDSDEFGGQVPLGAIELFKIIMGDIDDKRIHFYYELFHNYLSLEDSGGNYNYAYEDLQKLTENEFNVDDFKLIVDADSGNEPYFGYVEFFHRDKMMYYAPNQFIEGFGTAIFRYLNHFLAETQMSAKRFVNNCCFSSMMSQGYSGHAAIIFVDKERFDLLKQNHFIGDNIDDNFLFWQRKEKVEFVSISKA